MPTSAEQLRINGMKGGRPPGQLGRRTIDKLAAREALRRLILKHYRPMTLAQIKMAKGINVAVVRRKDGTFKRIDSPEAFDAAVEKGDLIEVHTLQPSTAAYTDLMNRALDKPGDAVTHEHTGTITIAIDVPWKAKRLPDVEV